MQHPKASPYIEYNIGQHNLAFQHIVAFEYLSTIRGARTSKITIASDYNEAVIRDLQHSHKIVFRHGYAGGPLSLPIIHYLTDYEIVFNALGINLTICGADQSLKINRGVRNRCFSDMPISEMVATIAKEHQLQIKIEDTDGKFTLRQIWLSDMQFLSDDLLPRAMSSENGRADYDLYIAGNTLHFHTPYYSNKVYRKHILGRNTMPHLRELKVRFCGEAANAYGGLSARAHGYDPYEKKIIVARADNISTPEKELLGSKTFLLDLPLTTNEGRYFHRTQGENFIATMAEAKSAWYHAQRKRYQAYMITDCDPGLEAGSVILLLVPTTQGYHMVSGRYLVQQVRHIMNTSSHRSEIVMIRNGTLAGEKDLIGIKRNSIVEDTKEGITRQSNPL